MAIEAIKGAGMVYQGSTSTAQIKDRHREGQRCPVRTIRSCLTASQGIFRR